MTRPNKRHDKLEDSSPIQWQTQFGFQGRTRQDRRDCHLRPAAWNGNSCRLRSRRFRPEAWTRGDSTRRHTRSTRARNIEYVRFGSRQQHVPKTDRLDSQRQAHIPLDHPDLPYADVQTLEEEAFRDLYKEQCRLEKLIHQLNAKMCAQSVA